MTREILSKTIKEMTYYIIIWVKDRSRATWLYDTIERGNRQDIVPVI